MNSSLVMGHLLIRDRTCRHTIVSNACFGFVPSAILMAVQIDQIEAFIAVVRRGGFTRAGQWLHLSQPAVSRRLEQLEQDLGRPLFDRARGRADLTDAGRAFLTHAEAVLAAIGDGREAVRALDQPDRGTVTLAI